MKHLFGQTIITRHVYPTGPFKLSNPRSLKNTSFFISPKCCYSRLRIWSRETGSAVPSRVSLLVSVLRLNLVLTYGIPPEFRGGVHLFTRYFKPLYAIGTVPNLSGHTIAYRWRSLPRVHRHRASKPQRSSKRVLPWQVTMDQLICASLSHTHYRYEEGMWKVPAWILYNGLKRTGIIPQNIHTAPPPIKTNKQKSGQSDDALFRKRKIKSSRVPWKTFHQKKQYLVALYLPNFLNLLPLPLLYSSFSRLLAVP